VKPARFHPAAVRELTDAVDYYNEQREELGDEFAAEVERSIELIRRDPTLPAPRPDGFRGRRCRRFPDTIFYPDLDEDVWIGAVAHQRRKPGYWARRSPD
jgi:plasmid stabilization system protein ParE